MIDNSRVTKDDANGLEPAAPRILARQLARPLTDDEVNHVAGGMMSRGRDRWRQPFERARHDPHYGLGLPRERRRRVIYLLPADLLRRVAKADVACKESIP